MSLEVGKDALEDCSQSQSHITAKLAKLQGISKQNEELGNEFKQLMQDIKKESPNCEGYMESEEKLSSIEGSLHDTDKLLQIKNEIIQIFVDSKKNLALDKNCDKKILLDTLGVGLNILEFHDSNVKVEFVINSLKIIISFDIETQKCSCKYSTVVMFSLTIEIKY